MSTASTKGTANAPATGSVWRLRIIIIVVVLALWELLSASGLLFRDVVPSLVKISKAIVVLLSSPDFYAQLGTTVGEIGLALLIGGTAGLAVGILLGANRYLSHAFEALLLTVVGTSTGALFYRFRTLRLACESWVGALAAAPIVLLYPLFLVIFGRSATTIVMIGFVAGLAPVILKTIEGLAGTRPVLLDVGQSFRATQWQMVTKIYLHAMREPIISGLRLGLGVAIVGTLLAETKLSNKGLGYLVIQAYALFDMPKMYALVIVLFVLSIGVNVLLGKLRGGAGANAQRR